MYANTHQHLHTQQFGVRTSIPLSHSMNIKGQPQAMTAKISHAIAIKASCARKKPSYRVKNKYVRI